MAAAATAGKRRFITREPQTPEINHVHELPGDDQPSSSLTFDRSSSSRDGRDFASRESGAGHRKEEVTKEGGTRREGGGTREGGGSREGGSDRRRHDHAHAVRRRDLTTLSSAISAPSRETTLGQNGPSAFVRVQPRSTQQSDQALVIPNRSSSFRTVGAIAALRPPFSADDPNPPWMNRSPGELELSRCHPGASMVPDAVHRGYSAPHHGGGIVGDDSGTLGAGRLGIRPNPMVYTPLVLPLSPRCASERDPVTFFGFRPIRRDSGGSESSSLAGSVVDTESTLRYSSSVLSASNSLINKLPPLHPSAGRGADPSTSNAASLLDVTWPPGGTVTGGAGAGSSGGKRPRSLYEAAAAGSGGSRTNLSSTGSASSYDNLDKSFGGGTGGVGSKDNVSSPRSRRVVRTQRERKADIHPSGSNHTSHDHQEVGGSNSDLFNIRTSDRSSGSGKNDNRIDAGHRPHRGAHRVAAAKEAFENGPVALTAYERSLSSQNHIPNRQPQFDISPVATSRSSSGDKRGEISTRGNNGGESTVAPRSAFENALMRRTTEHRHVQVVPPHLVGVFDPEKLRAEAAAASSASSASRVTTTPRGPAPMAKDSACPWTKWQPESVSQRALSGKVVLRGNGADKVPADPSENWQHSRLYSPVNTSNTVHSPMFSPSSSYPPVDPYNSATSLTSSSKSGPVATLQQRGNAFALFTSSNAQAITPRFPSDDSRLSAILNRDDRTSSTTSSLSHHSPIEQHCHIMRESPTNQTSPPQLHRGHGRSQPTTPDSISIKPHESGTHRQQAQLPPWETAEDASSNKNIMHGSNTADGGAHRSARHQEATISAQSASGSTPVSQSDLRVASLISTHTPITSAGHSVKSSLSSSSSAPAMSHHIQASLNMGVTSTITHHTPAQWKAAPQSHLKPPPTTTAASDKADIRNRSTEDINTIASTTYAIKSSVTTAKLGDTVAAGSGPVAADIPSVSTTSVSVTESFPGFQTHLPSVDQHEKKSNDRDNQCSTKTSSANHIFSISNGCSNVSNSYKTETVRDQANSMASGKGPESLSSVSSDLVVTNCDTDATKGKSEFSEPPKESVISTTGSVRHYVNDGSVESKSSNVSDNSSGPTVLPAGAPDLATTKISAVLSANNAATTSENVVSSPSRLIAATAAATATTTETVVAMATTATKEEKSPVTTTTIATAPTKAVSTAPAIIRAPTITANATTTATTTVVVKPKTATAKTTAIANTSIILNVATTTLTNTTDRSTGGGSAGSKTTPLLKDANKIALFGNSFTENKPESKRPGSCMRTIGGRQSSFELVEKIKPSSETINTMTTAAAVKSVMQASKKTEKNVLKSSSSLTALNKLSSEGFSQASFLSAARAAASTSSSMTSTAPDTTASTPSSISQSASKSVPTTAKTATSVAVATAAVASTTRPTNIAHLSTIKPSADLQTADKVKTSIICASGALPAVTVASSVAKQNGSSSSTRQTNTGFSNATSGGSSISAQYNSIAAARQTNASIAVSLPAHVTTFEEVTSTAKLELKLIGDKNTNENPSTGFSEQHATDVPSVSAVVISSATPGSMRRTTSTFASTTVLPAIAEVAPSTHGDSSCQPASIRVSGTNNSTVPAKSVISTAASNISSAMSTPVTASNIVTTSAGLASHHMSSCNGIAAVAAAIGMNVAGKAKAVAKVLPITSCTSKNKVPISATVASPIAQIFGTSGAAGTTRPTARVIEMSNRKYVQSSSSPGRRTAAGTSPSRKTSAVTGTPKASPPGYRASSSVVMATVTPRSTTGASPSRRSSASSPGRGSAGRTDRSPARPAPSLKTTGNKMAPVSVVTTSSSGHIGNSPSRKSQTIVVTSASSCTQVVARDGNVVADVGKQNSVAIETSCNGATLSTLTSSPAASAATTTTTATVVAAIVSTTSTAAIMTAAVATTTATPAITTATSAATTKTSFSTHVSPDPPPVSLSTFSINSSCSSSLTRSALATAVITAQPFSTNSQPVSATGSIQVTSSRASFATNSQNIAATAQASKVHSVSVPIPAVAVSQPVFGTSQVSSASQIAVTTNKPKLSASIPASTISQLLVTTAQPVLTTSQTIPVTAKHLATTSQPSSATSQPASVTYSSVSVVSEASSVAYASVSTTSQPVLVTSQPTPMTSSPISITSQPVRQMDSVDQKSSSTAVIAKPISSTSSTRTDSSINHVNMTSSNHASQADDVTKKTTNPLSQNQNVITSTDREKVVTSSEKDQTVSTQIQLTSPPAPDAAVQKLVNSIPLEKTEVDKNSEDIKWEDEEEEEEEEEEDDWKDAMEVSEEKPVGSSQHIVSVTNLVVCSPLFTKPIKLTSGTGENPDPSLESHAFRPTSNEKSAKTMKTSTSSSSSSSTSLSLSEHGGSANILPVNDVTVVNKWVLNDAAVAAKDVSNDAGARTFQKSQPPITFLSSSDPPPTSPSVSHDTVMTSHDILMTSRDTASVPRDTTVMSEVTVMAALDNALAMLTSVVMGTKDQQTTDAKIPTTTTVESLSNFVPTPIALIPPEVPPRTSVNRAYTAWLKEGGRGTGSPPGIDSGMTKTEAKQMDEITAFMLDSSRLEKKIVEINKKYSSKGAPPGVEQSGEGGEDGDTGNPPAPPPPPHENGVYGDEGDADSLAERRRRFQTKEDSFNRADSPMFHETLPLPKESVIKRYRQHERDSTTSSSASSRDTSPMTSSPRSARRNARPRQRRKGAAGSSGADVSASGPGQKTKMRLQTSQSMRFAASSERLSLQPLDDVLLDNKELLVAAGRTTSSSRRPRRSKTTAAVPHRHRKKHDVTGATSHDVTGAAARNVTSSGAGHMNLTEDLNGFHGGQPGTKSRVVSTNRGTGMTSGQRQEKRDRLLS